MAPGTQYFQANNTTVATAIPKGRYTVVSAVDNASTSIPTRPAKTRFILQLMLGNTWDTTNPEFKWEIFPGKLWACLIASDKVLHDRASLAYQFVQAMRDDGSTPPHLNATLNPWEGDWEVLKYHSRPRLIKDWTRGKTVINLIVNEEWRNGKAIKKSLINNNVFTASIRYRPSQLDTPRYSSSPSLPDLPTLLGTKQEKAAEPAPEVAVAPT
jgi:hypothetical protein